LSGKNNQNPPSPGPSPHHNPASAEKVKTSRFEWERDQFSEPGKSGPVQARIRRWLQLAQEFVSSNRDWDGDDDPTPSAA
jgi:hypothetical protein